MSPSEVEAIVMAEFRYWFNASGEDERMACMEMGALGACSNIIAAMCGRPAPWHPQLKTEPEPARHLRPVPGFPGWINP